MSSEPSELRTLLRSAATVPASEPDLALAERRGRVLRARRRAVNGFVSLVLVASGAAVVAAMAKPDHHPSTASSAVASAVPTCPAPSRATDDVPSWAASARPPKGVPHLLSRERNVIGFLFGYPLRAGHPKNRTNKILFVMREPRNGRPLNVTGTLAGRRSTHTSIKGDSAPGEIYPSVINVPAPGCWQFALRWNGHNATINLAYR